MNSIVNLMSNQSGVRTLCLAGAAPGEAMAAEPATGPDKAEEMGLPALDDVGGQQPGVSIDFQY